MQKLTILIAFLFCSSLVIGQRTSVSPKPATAPTPPKSDAADLSIVSIAVVYPGPANPPTLNTAHGVEQGNPNSAAANPITQCTVVLHEAGAPNDNIMLDVTLPLGVKVRQMPANATTGPGPDYHTQDDGIIHIPVGHLNSGQSITLQFTYSTPPVTQGLRNQVAASVKGAQLESNMSNNTMTAILR